MHHLNSKASIKACLAASLLLLLGGCASLFAPDFEIVDSGPLTPGPILDAEEAKEHWLKQQQQLTQIKQWQIMGKLGVFTAEEKISLNLFWQQTGSDYEVIISDLFGSPILEMQKQGSTVWLRIEQEEEYWGRDPERLIQQLIGWHLPIEALPQWLLGLPGHANYQLNNQGVIKKAQLEENGQWLVDYAQYQYWQERLLPRKLQISKKANKLKIIISDWKLIRFDKTK